MKLPIQRLFGVMAVLFLVSCENQPMTVQHEHAAPTFAQVSTGELSGLARAVRQATSHFNSTTQATKAGYHEDSPCVAAPGLGGMGFHWVNRDLVDPVFDPMNPEAVLYEPTKHGDLRLTGFEYIVINVGQPAPMFEGQPFDVGGAPLPVPHWTLHLWVHKANPAGMFTPFNPDVVCP